MPSMLGKPREYLVYDAFLKHLFPNGFKKLVAVSYTFGCVEDFAEQGVKYIRKEMPSVKDDTLTDFDRMLGQVVRLEPAHFNLATSICFTNCPLSDEYGIHELRRDYPTGDGLVTLSCVGFDKAGLQALGYVGINAHEWFPNMGFGYYLLACHDEERWQVCDETLAWIA